MEEKLRDNGYKHLSIANPLHGEEFFSMLFKKDWSDKSMIGITKDKLYSLCSAKITIERYKELLHTMILTKAKDPKATHFADYKKLRFYMRQEAYWQGMFEEATLIIAKLQFEGLELPATFDGFFKTSQKLHVTQAYNTVLGTMKSASDCATLPEPHLWKEESHHGSVSHCPWWLEYPLGVVPKSEEAIHDYFLNKHREKATTSRHKSISKDVLQEPTSKKKKKLPRKKVDFHTPISDDNDEEKSLPSPPQRDIQESKSCGASKSIMLESIITRSKSENIFIYVDAFLLDIESIDDFAWHYCYEKEYHLKGEASKYVVAALIFADFPTSMLVFGIQDNYVTDDVEGDILAWNQFSTRLVRGVMDIVDVHLADEGFLVTLSLAQHLGKIERHARIFGLHLHRSWTLMCDGGYLHRDTREQVLDLTIGLFYRKISTGIVPQYDRGAREFVSSDMFPAKRSYLSELPTRTKSEYTHVNELMVRGGEEHTPSFLSWMLASFTDKDDHVLDLFAGCGPLGDACSKEMRHCCLMLE
ncbi:hypothetical protein L7F22_005815 [Adiantum nelumboides]|nr:hypothetical protein [Adiantum nelumboides]